MFNTNLQGGFLMRLCASVFALAVLSPLSALAQDAPPPAPAAVEAAPPAAAPVVAAPAAAPVVVPAAVAAAPTPAKTWKDLITIDGLVDSYYMYNFSGTGPNKSLVPAAGRQFDTNSNTFTLNYAKIGIGMSSDNVALRMDLGYGSMGNIINGAAQPFLAQQAFMSVTPVPNFTIDFGKFMTTAGAEVIEANKNWLYSRSILFFNIPLVHTGLRLNYKINDMVSVQGSVVNGWNGQGFEVDANEAKTFGLNATITLPMGVAILPTVYIGKEAGSTGTRFLGDLVATYAMGPLGLNLNFDYIQDKNEMVGGGINPFLGVALMAHYAVSDKLNVTARGEYAQQKPLVGDTAKLEEFTIGLAAPIAGHFEVRPEIRADFSSPALFNEAIDPMMPNFKKTQVTALVAGLAYF
jgi:Putative beta-barrel porin-2, OmpL-like. bbp2